MGLSFLKGMRNTTFAINSSGFRTDIEGLRAIAILLVVGAHLGIPELRGGFVGVDVFFVISGYLITQILSRELERTGTLDFASFYARRMRRLLPALFLMVLTTLAAALLLLSPLEIRGIAQSALAATAYISNGWFLINFVDYFSPGVSSNPLLHTWSLGVEEQFYLLWPPLLFIWMRKSKRQRKLLVPLLATLILSFVLCIWFTYTHQPVAFFSSPTRTWEFAAGGLIALPTSDRVTRWFSTGVFGWVGVAAIGASAILLNPDHPFPGLAALIPVAGTMLVLLSGKIAVPDTTLCRLLSNPLFRQIGQVSYSWYLWHWPILVFGRILFPRGGLMFAMVLALLSLAIATVLYDLVENPVRIRPILVQNPRYSIAMGVALTFTGALGAALGISITDYRAQSPLQSPYLHAAMDTGEGCMTGFHRDQLTRCSFGPEGAQAIVLFGDSHAAQWLPALKVIAQSNRWHLVTLLKASCPSVSVPVFNPRLERYETECVLWRRNALNFIAIQKPWLVLMSNSSGYVRQAGVKGDYARLSVHEWQDGLRQTLNALDLSGTRTVILRDTPRPDIDIPVCLSRASSHPALFPFQECYAIENQALSADLWAAELTTAGHFDLVSALDLTPAFCSAGICPAQINDTVVYRDSNHISALFAAKLASTFADQLTATLGRSPPLSAVLSSGSN